MIYADVFICHIVMNTYRGNDVIEEVTIDLISILYAEMKNDRFFRKYNFGSIAKIWLGIEHPKWSRETRDMRRITIVLQTNGALIINSRSASTSTFTLADPRTSTKNIIKNVKNRLKAQ